MSYQDDLAQVWRLLLDIQIRMVSKNNYCQTCVSYWYIRIFFEILIINDQVISNKDDTNPMMVCISYLFVHMMITTIHESENYDMYSLLFKTFITLNIAIQDIDLILPLQMFESSPLILRNRKLDCLHWNIFQIHIIVDETL